MNKLVQDKIKEARKGQEKTPPLREAMQAVYSRPNEDFMIEKIVGPLRTELDEIESWEPVMRSLVDEAVNALKDPKGLKAEAQVTYAIMLENMMAELQPDAANAFEKGIFTQIRDAHIELTSEANKERQLRIMKKVKSPSDIAADILKNVAKNSKNKDENIKSRNGH